MRAHRPPDCDIPGSITSVGGGGGDTLENDGFSRANAHHEAPKASSYPHFNASTAKPGHLSPEVLPLLHEMLMQIPSLFEAEVFSRLNCERLTASALHLLGSILYGSIYNALQVSTPAILDALLWLMKHRIKIGASCEDELVVTALLCLVRMVHVLHGAPSVDLRQLEVDAHMEEYLRFMSDLPYDGGQGQRLKQILLDHIAVILNCPNRHSLQQIMLINCNAFGIIRSELCRCFSALSIPSNNPNRDTALPCAIAPVPIQLLSDPSKGDSSTNNILRNPSLDGANPTHSLLSKLIRVLTQLMHHSTPAKEYFNVQIGFSFLLESLSKIDPLSEVVVNAVVDMVFDGFEESLSATTQVPTVGTAECSRKLANPKAAVMLVGLLPYIYDDSQRLRAVKQIYHYAQSSIVCRAHFVESRMLLTILIALEENLSRTSMMPTSVTKLLHQLVILLAEFSLSSLDLWRILHGLRKTVDSCGGSLNPGAHRLHANFLLKCLKRISSPSPPSSPLKYFDLTRHFDGVFVENVKTFDNCFIFHCWLCVEKMQQNEVNSKPVRRTLFSFTDPSGAGFEAFFSCPGDELLIVYRTKQKFLVTPVRVRGGSTFSTPPVASDSGTTTLCDGHWHSLTIVYNMAVSASTVRKGSNKLLGLTSSIASAVLGPASTAAAATSVTVYIDGLVAGDAVIMVQNNSKLHEMFSRCVIGAAAVSNHVTNVDTTSDGKRDRTATSNEGAVIAIPLGTEDDIWGTPVALHGLVGTVCVFSELLSPILLKSLHDAGPNACGLNRTVADVLQTSNRLYLHFSPYACDEALSNLEKGFTSGLENLPDLWRNDAEDMLSAANCINLAIADVGHAKFIGRVAQLSSVYDAIAKLGGVACFLPLIEACNVLVVNRSCDASVPETEKVDDCSVNTDKSPLRDQSYDRNIARQGKRGGSCDTDSVNTEKYDDIYDHENPLACCFTILRNIVSSRARDYDVDDLAGIFAAVPVLLTGQKSEIKIITVDVLFATQILAELLLFEFAAQHPNPLCADFLRYVLFNFDLWSNMADFTVQIGHVQFLRKTMRDQKKLFCRQYGYGVQFLLDIVKRYYLSCDLGIRWVGNRLSDKNSHVERFEADSDFAETRLNSGLNSDDSKAIRASIFSIIRDIVSRDTRAEDVRALIGFMLSVVNDAVSVVEELVDLCIIMMQSDNSRNLSDQFLLHMFEQDNAELLFYIVTLKSVDRNRDRRSVEGIATDSNRNEKSVPEISAGFSHSEYGRAINKFDSSRDSNILSPNNRLSIVKQKVLRFIDLLLATPKVYEKSKVTLRLDDAGGITGLMMFFNGNAELSESVMLTFVNQLLQFQQEKNEDETESGFAHLLALTNKLHHVTSIDTKLQIARRFLTSLFMRPRAAHQLSKISGWCLSLLSFLVEEPIRATRNRETSKASNLISFESIDLNPEEHSVTSGKANTDSISLTSSTVDGDFPPLQIIDDDESSTTTLEPFELLASSSQSDASLSNSLSTTRLESRSVLTLPLCDSSEAETSLTPKSSTSVQCLPTSFDRPRLSDQDASNLSELIAIVVNMIFTTIWKGMDGFDRPAWLRRAQAFTSIDVMALSNILYTDRQCVKRGVLDMLLTAVTMDFGNSSPANELSYTAILENSLSVLKLCYDFCCYGNLLDFEKKCAEFGRSSAAECSKIQNFLEKFLLLCESVLAAPKSASKSKIVDRLDLVTMHRAVLLQCISSESLDVVAFGASRLHGVITTSSSSPNMVSALRIREVEEAAHLMFELNQQLVLDLEMGNWERYSICAPLWKNMLQQCGALLNAEHYLFKVPLNESGEEFLEKLKFYLLSATPTATSPGSEWKAFLKCIVEALFNKFKVKYIDKRRERMSTFWNECYESTVEGLHMRNRLFGEAKLKFQVRIIRRALRRQRDEEKRFAYTLTQHDDDCSAIRRRWQRQTSCFITSERGPWGRVTPADADNVGFELKPFENVLRIRPCVDKCWNFDRSLFNEAAQLRDNTHSLSQNLTMSSDEQQLLLLKRASAKKHVDAFDEADEDWDVILTAAAAEREIANDEPAEQDTEEFLSTFFSSSSQVPNNPKFILREQCTRVTPAYVVDGIFRVTSHAICFTPMMPSDNSDGATHNSNKLILADEMAVYVRLDALKELHLRRYNLRRSAVEFFLTNQTNFFFNFADVPSRNKVCSRIISLRPPNMVYYKGRSPAALLKASGITQRWMQREIGNFEYIMALNTVAGRSFNDLAQYPVFPWIVKKFDVEVLDVNDPDTFRDLSRPMGVQNYLHVSEVRAKYEGFDDPETPPFHYGQHYSTPATVIHYLVRLEPFSSLHVALQSGRWDLADRQFYNIASTWKLLYDNPNEVKELTPEFFALPEFLRNVNHFDLGRLQGRSTSRVDDVILPRWAHTAEEFVYHHRRALECEFVSARLHHWIDLIFGYKQRGPAAVDALNVFYYCTYEGNVDLDAIEDPIQRKALEGMINNFGQTPSQLLQEPHPRRMSYEEATHRALKASDRSLDLFNYLKHLRLRAYVDAQGSVDDACVFVGLARYDSSSLATSASSSAVGALLSPAAAPALINPRSLFVQATTMATSIVGENTVITVGASGAIGIHAWQPNAPSGNNTASAVAFGAVAATTMSPVFWEFDVSVKNKTLRNIAGPFHPRFSATKASRTTTFTAEEGQATMNSNLFVLSNDGKLLISAGHWDNSIRVFNIYRSKTICHISLHRETVTCLGIDTFGLHLISGSRDGAVYIWMISQQPGELGTATAFGGMHRKPRRFLCGHVDCGVVAVAISTELDTALSAGDDNTIIVSGVEHGEYKRTLRPFDDFSKSDEQKRSVKTGTIAFVSISPQTAHIYVATNRITFAVAADESDDPAGLSFASILLIYSINGKFLYHRTFSDAARTAASITCMKCAPCADYCLITVETSQVTTNVNQARLTSKTRRGLTPISRSCSRSTSFAGPAQNGLHVVEWFKLSTVASVPLAARGLSLEVARGNSHILVGLQNGQVAIVTALLDSNKSGGIQTSAANALSAITDADISSKSFSRTVNRLINSGFGSNLV